MYNHEVCDAKNDNFKELHQYISSWAAEHTQKCGAQLTNKTHFYCKKLNFYKQLIKFVGALPCSTTCVSVN